MADLDRARYVRMSQQDGHYVIVLLDDEKREVGYGYKGPTLKRAETDLKYWIARKGLEDASG